uniref:Uncharacterized protein n=1 Tax=Dongxihu virus TaxID=2656653 RepID=A0A5P8PP32_9VIRU|nr:MAG: hypothetical protein [Dongxihu virus]
MAVRSHKRLQPVRETGFESASTKIDIRNIPNPYFNKVMQLAESPEYDHIMGLVGDATEEEEIYKLALIPDVMEKLYKMLDRFEQAPLVPPTMPPAPQSLQLYSRTADDAYVADIGSGDTKKAAKSNSKMKFYDINPTDEKVTAFDADTDMLPEADVYTSYNTLTQLRSPERLMEKDSLHIFPDIDYIKNTMGSEIKGDGTIITKTGDKTFTDFDNDLPGDTVSEGYKCITGYSRGYLSLMTTNRVVRTRGFGVPVKDTMTELQGSATKKYDGVALLLSFRGGLASLVTRKGLGVELSHNITDSYCDVCKWFYTGDQCTSKRCRKKSVALAPRSYAPKDFDMIVEKVRRPDGKNEYVLLRVLNYGRFVPFHGLASLRQFCAMIKITIDGDRIKSPDDPSLLDLPHDGLIYRDGGMDYRLKSACTIDLYSPTAFVEYAMENGYQVDYDRIGKNEGQMFEYSICRSNMGRFIMTEERRRFDKDKETDYKGMLDRIMDTASLHTKIDSPSPDDSSLGTSCMTLTDTIE